jgi:hypothetical protein
MKKICCLTLFSVIVLTVFSQSTPAVKTDYLQKSKKQKTAAFVLLGGGAGLAIAGTAIGVNRWDDEIGSIVSEGENDDAYTAGGVLLVTGVAAMVGSVPLFIAASRNKKKAYAASAYFKMETIPVVYQRGIGKLPYPAACVAIGL